MPRSSRGARSLSSSAGTRPRQPTDATVRHSCFTSAGSLPASDWRDRAEFGRMIVRAARLRRVEDLRQAAAGVARVDDVVDAESFGRAQGADAGPRLVDHLLAAGGRIGGGL